MPMVSKSHVVSVETGTAVRLGWTAQSKNTAVAGPVKPGVTHPRTHNSFVEYRGRRSNALPLRETSEEVTSSTKGTKHNEDTVSEPSLICSSDEPQGRKGVETAPNSVLVSQNRILTLAAHRLEQLKKIEPKVVGKFLNQKVGEV
ncbi:hypothetical protein B0H14DRAFT_2556815 [Mycena olivaceomarginata]|nr:hypothetical protein B0H14DRAFT_2556815 [Mycena olivaceomarginata]